MESLPSLSFVSGAASLTLLAYNAPRSHSVVVSEIIGRIAAFVLLSPAAGFDICMHGLFVLPVLAYAIGKSVYLGKADFNLPWQHLQRIRNAVSPLLLGSVFGLIHPYAGVGVSEPTDKHIALGILSSNVTDKFETPCSPIHSLSIVEDIARSHRFVEHDGETVEIFTEEHINAIRGARDFEKSLEAMQAQEYIHKITNVTLFVMASIKMGIEQTNLSPLTQDILVRLSGLFIPVLTAVDITITLLVQAFFLTTGAIRLISGRGPIYTEVTTNPLMHISFLIQNTLKAVGNLIGTFVWFISPMDGFKTSLYPANLFFELQKQILFTQIKLKLHFAKENSCFVIPILYGEGECSAFSVPTHSSHKTYLIVEKTDKAFNLYWVNRPTVDRVKDLDKREALTQIEKMIEERYPFMDIKKMMNYPVKSIKPEFTSDEQYAKIAEQGNSTNCVVSNLFGMLATIDLINGNEEKLTSLRHKVVREALLKKYDFYKEGFAPFSGEEVWDKIALHPDADV